MKLKYNFEDVNMGEEIVAVPVGNDAGQVHGVVKMNKAGNIIFNLLKKETTKNKIIDELSTIFDDGKETLEGYVNDVLKELQEFKLLE